MCIIWRLPLRHIFARQADCLARFDRSISSSRRRLSFHFITSLTAMPCGGQGDPVKKALFFKGRGRLASPTGKIWQLPGYFDEDGNPTNPGDLHRAAGQRRRTRGAKAIGATTDHSGRPAAKRHVVLLPCRIMRRPPRTALVTKPMPRPRTDGRHLYDARRA